MSRIIPLLISVCGAFAYTLGERISAGGGPGFWDYALELSANIPFVVYVLLPASLLVVVFEARSRTPYWILMRFGSVWSAFAGTVRAATRVTALLLTGVFVGTLLGSIGAPVRATAAPGTASATFREAGVSPIVAYLAGMAVIAALLFTSAVLIAACSLTARPVLAFVAAAVGWAWVLSSLQFGWGAGIALEGFLTPLDWVGRDGAWVPRLIGCAAIIGVAVLLIKMKDWILPWGAPPSVSVAGVAMSLGGVVVGASVLTQSQTCSNAAECLARSFPGVEGTLLQILGWLSMPVFAVLAVMLRALAVSDGVLPVTLIRFGSAGREFDAAVRRALPLLGLAFALWGIAALLPVFVLAPVPAEPLEWMRVIVAVFLQPLLFSIDLAILFLVLSRLTPPQVSIPLTCVAGVAAPLAVPVELWTLAGLSGGRFAFMAVTDQVHAVLVLVLIGACLFGIARLTLRAAVPGFRKEPHDRSHLHPRHPDIPETPAVRGRGSHPRPR